MILKDKKRLIWQRKKKSIPRKKEGWQKGEAWNPCIKRMVWKEESGKNSIGQVEKGLSLITLHEKFESIAFIRNH